MEGSMKVWVGNKGVVSRSDTTRVDVSLWQGGILCRFWSHGVSLVQGRMLWRGS